MVATLDLDKGGGPGYFSLVEQGPTLGWVKVQNATDGQAPSGFYNLSTYAQNYETNNGLWPITAQLGVYVKNPVTTNNGQGAIVGGIEVSIPINNAPHTWGSGVYGFGIGTPANGVNVGTIRGGDFDGVFGGPGLCDTVSGSTHYCQIDGGTVTEADCLYTIGPFIVGGTVTNTNAIHILAAFGLAPSGKQAGLRIDSNGHNNSFGIIVAGVDACYFGSSVIAGGDQAPLATTATFGFLYIASCAGTPTGVPVGFAGTVPMVYDTSAHKLWINDAGTWKFAQFN